MSDIPTHLQPRVVALLRAVARDDKVFRADNAQEARALVAELPEPPDPLLEEAREICAVAAANQGEQWLSRGYRAGEYDESFRMEVALTALRRGKEIGRSGE